MGMIDAGLVISSLMLGLMFEVDAVSRGKTRCTQYLQLCFGLMVPVEGFIALG
jgi:hypothetical protein